MRLVTALSEPGQDDAKQVMPALLTRLAIGILDGLAGMFLADESPQHLRIGKYGEEDVYFELRKLGYIMVARNFHSRDAMARLI